MTDTSNSWPVTRIIVCGDRHWVDRPFMREKLRLRYSTATEVIHGDNGNDRYTEGADRIAHTVAEEIFAISPKPHPADWDKWGSYAGPKRNTEMLLEHGRIDEVCAFHDDLQHSKGTKDMLRQARKAGVPTIVFSHHDPEPPEQGKLF